MTDLGPIFLARQFFSVLADTPKYCAASRGLSTTGRSTASQRGSLAFDPDTRGLPAETAGATPSASNNPICLGSMRDFVAGLAFRFVGDFDRGRLVITFASGPQA